MKKLHWRKWIAGLLLVSTVWTQCFSYALATDISDVNEENESVEEVNSNIDESVIETSSEEESSEEESSEAESSEAESSEAESSEEESSEAESSETESNEVESEQNEAVETSEDGGNEGVIGAGSEGLTEDDTEEEFDNEGVDYGDEELDFIPMFSTFALTDESNYCDLYDSSTWPWDRGMIAVNGDTLVVYGAEGLIALSYIKPSQYCNKTIELTMRDSTVSNYDLTISLNTNSGDLLNFNGLGSTEYPFSGTLKYASGSIREWKTNRPIFNAIKTSANLAEIETTADINTNEVVLADTVYDGNNGTNEWKVKVKGGKIGGIIENLKSGEAKLAVTIVTGSISCESDGHSGLFCREMTEETTLTTNLLNESSQKITVKGNNDVGGIVGKMNSGAVLKASKLLPNEIITYNGNAGGVVGNVCGGARIESISAEPIILYNSTVQSGSNNGAGGIAGIYRYDGTNPIVFGNFSWGANTDNRLGLKQGVAGAIVGIMESTVDYTLNSTGNKIPIRSGSSDWVNAYGGLLGSYEPYTGDNKGNRNLYLQIGNFDVDVDMQNNKPSTFGGVIGKTPVCSYLEFNDITVKVSNAKADCFGGIVGNAGEQNPSFLNVGSYRLSGNVPEDMNTFGGVVGKLSKGIVRLHGTTDISGFEFKASGGKRGQIVGDNGNGLVYATGTGNDAVGDTGWKLIRYSDATASDIGNWGTVIRLDGTKLKETTVTNDTDECYGGDATTLFVLNTKLHTVTVQGNPQIENRTIGSVRDFAAYALAFDYAQDRNFHIPSLLYGLNVSTNEKQNVIISADIDLQGTGILGIGRDIAADFWSTDGLSFSGTITGSNANIKVTLDNGWPSYGENCGNSALWVSQYSHDAIAMIPNAKDITIQNLMITGKLNSKSDNNGDSKNIASAVAVGADSVIFENVICSTVINIEGNNAGEYCVAGFLGRYIGGSDGGQDSIIFRKNCIWDGLIESANEGYIGGMIARIEAGYFWGSYHALNNEVSIEIKSASIKGSLSTTAKKNTKLGGLIAYLKPRKDTPLSISKLTIEGCKISANSLTDHCGGFLGDLWDQVDVTFGGDSSSYGVDIKGSTLSAQNCVFGGLVYEATGYWNVTAPKSIRFLTNGATKNSIDGKTSRNNPSALLVSVGVRGENDTAAALYFEMGTWGDANSASYYVSPETLDLTLRMADNSDLQHLYFDEIVGRSIARLNAEQNDYESRKHQSGIVSLATSMESTDTIPLINVNGRNTYVNQMGKNYKCYWYGGTEKTGSDIPMYENLATRYHYNLNYMRKKGLPGTMVDFQEYVFIKSSKDLVLWSVSQQAAENIRDKFCAYATLKLVIWDFGKPSINLRGYSYYPVTPFANIKIDSVGLYFDYEDMNGLQAKNKEFCNFREQHYLMHNGLAFNGLYDLLVLDTTLGGTVGIYHNSSDGAQTNFSGVLLLGNISGFSSEREGKQNITLKSITLDGLRYGESFSELERAPLLISAIGTSTNFLNGIQLEVNGITTTSEYQGKSSAATSLLGPVGHAAAKKLTVSFSNIALDARVNSGSKTYLYNNGVQDEAHKVEYGTYQSIFTKATLLHSFQYNTECSGVYNFMKDDNKVTYGKEISNTTTGRNIKKQYCYYDTEGENYVWDGEGNRPGAPDSGENSIEEYFLNKYLPYVFIPETTGENNYKELDVNLHIPNLVLGCGTYGDPYQIKSGEELTFLAEFLMNGKTNNAWAVCVNKGVYKGYINKDLVAGDFAYHTNSAVSESDEVYVCEGETWYNATYADNKYTKGDEEKNINSAGMRAYLRNAYFQIVEDITISNSSYIGIGYEYNEGVTPINQAFSGVIVGEKKADGTYPTVTISVENQNTERFGGLICYSQGSVVKDLNISYIGKENDARIKLVNNAAVSTSNERFFGGVVGYCIGGDTIIDNVSVQYAQNSVDLVADDTGYFRLIPVGGYVGLVGGAWNGKGEPNGGGVVFRNMSNTDNPFKLNTSLNEKSADSSKLLYCNPFVGRVLDGYACYDTNVDANASSSRTMTPTLNNTEKNYTIPNLYTGDNGLVVDKDMNIQVSTAQGLWLLSAIVNSGAGAMGSDGKYTNFDANIVEAYHSGKVRSRTCTYNEIGEAATEEFPVEARLSDEKWWGGVAYSSDNATEKVSYLVSGFTAKASDGNGNEYYYAARVCGKNSSSGSGQNYFTSLSFTSSSIDMINYHNGFRGIGASYGYTTVIWNDTNVNANWKKMWRRNLFINSFSGVVDTKTRIILDRKHRLYNSKDYGCQGVGLFINFGAKDGTMIKNLILSGTVKAMSYPLDLSETSIGGTKREEGWAFTSDSDNVADFCVSGLAVKTLYTNQTTTSNISVNNILLSNLEVIGGKNTGGLFGCIEQSGKNYKNITISDWDMDNLKVESFLYKSGSVGGLIGWYYGNANATINKCLNIANKNTSTISSVGNAGSFAGGIVGASDNGTVTLQDVDLSKFIVKGYNANAIGGVIGKNNRTLSINNTTLKDINIQGDNNTRYSGGVVGFNDGSGNCTFKKVSICGDFYVYGDYSSKRNAVGGFVGYTKKECVFKECKLLGTEEQPIRILNISITSGGDDTYANGTGAFVGVYNNSSTSNSNYMQINSCKMDYVNILSALSAGGVVGYLRNNDTTCVTDMSISNSVIAVQQKHNFGELKTGVLSAEMDSQAILQGINILIDNTIIGLFSQMNNVTNASKAADYLGIMKTTMNADNIGFYTDWQNTFKAYNSMDGSEFVCGNDNVCRLVGGNQGSAKLVAVAVDYNDKVNKKCYMPSKDTNIWNANIIYTDYLIDQNNQNDTVAPWLERNTLNSSLEIRESNTDSKIALYGNGVAMTNQGGVNVAIPKLILENEIGTTTKFWRQYGNITESSTNKTSLLNPESQVYLSTFAKEEGGIFRKLYGENGAQTGTQEVDFPVLVINKSDSLSDDIWKYVSALINANGQERAKNSADSIQLSSYKWVADSQDPVGGSFVKLPQDEASLDFDSSSKTFSLNGRYDNQQSQFTLLDMTYSVITKKNETRVYHLYVPLFVRKILKAKVSLKLMEGTNYNLKAYGQNNSVTLSFDNSFTALLEYNYARSRDEWQASLDSGENLLWSYQKKISLYGATGETYLPIGTRFTLLDRQTEKFYTYEFTENTRERDIQNLISSNLKDLLNIENWVDTPICDLLEIKADPDNDNGKFIRISADATKDELALASVRVRNSEKPSQYDYYRLMTEDDTGDELKRYSLTIGADAIGADTYLAHSEAYYLTICIPKESKGDIVVINNSIQYPDRVLIKSDGTKAPPTELTKDSIIKNYVVYDFLAPNTLNIQTNRVNGLNNHNGESGTDMESGDSIKIELDTTVSLQSRSYQDNGEERNTIDLFKNYKPQALYQQYVISLKDFKDGSVKGEDVPIFADGVTVDYYIYYDSTNPYEESNTESYESVTKTELSANEQGQTVYRKEFKVATQILETEEYYGVSELVLQPVLLPRNDLAFNHCLQVKAVVTLQYNDVEQQKFPTSGGIGVCSKSRVSTDKNTLPIGIIAKADDGDRYYTKVVSRAKLSVNVRESQEAVEKGDSNIQLGINSEDPLYNPVDEELSITTVNAIARYDYSQLDAGVVSGENKRLMFTLSLYQKQDNGTYDTSKPLILQEYLQDIKVVEEAMTETGTLENCEKTQSSYSEDGKKFNIICSFTPTLDASSNEESQEKIYSLPFDFSVITGKAFEEAGHTYANYKVIVEAYIVDEAGTNAEDSLVYTNARVMTHMLKN